MSFQEKVTQQCVDRIAQSCGLLNDFYRDYLGKERVIFTC